MTLVFRPTAPKGTPTTEERRYMTTEERWERAFARARELRRHVRYEGDGLYSILPSEGGERYMMRQTGGGPEGADGWECSCPSSGPCKHLAALFVRLQREMLRTVDVLGAMPAGGELFDDEVVAAEKSTAERTPWTLKGKKCREVPLTSALAGYYD